jgi:CheY-like chemotaxis protein
LNLLGNAAKFTLRGAVELRVGVRESPLPPNAASRQLRFEVADTGPGVPAEQSHLLFEEFKRLDTAMAGESLGAGLGLSLSKKLASLLGGFIEYAPNPGGGSLFQLDIPFVADDAAMSSPALPDFASRTNAAEASAMPRGRILVVDDVDINRDIAASFLRKSNYDIVCADGGVPAVQLAAEQDFVAILMDVRMPGVDGLEASRRIRVLDSPRGQVPIVALTAQVLSSQIESCRAAGMDTHLAKPFTMQTLTDGIARAIAVAAVRDAQRPKPSSKPDEVPQEINEGLHLAVLDEDVMSQTAGLLERDALAIHLRKLAGKMSELQGLLQERHEIPGRANSLAAAAHALAGSAGIFGFDRLTFTARAFECAADRDPNEAVAFAECLDRALSVTLIAVDDRIKYTGLTLATA